jgi:ABC-type polar amino acid transport system ATPase subunit
MILSAEGASRIINTLEAISKMQITFKDKARADEKAESARVRWRMGSTFEEACDELSRVVSNTVIGR